MRRVDNIKKAAFQLKLSGPFDVIVEHAFAHGFMGGHEFGKMMGQVIPADLEEALKEYKRIYEGQNENGNHTCGCRSFWLRLTYG